jgi:DNA-binding response OmpR family regulator
MYRILIVEDNADLAFGLRNNLEFEGYEVDWVGNGTEALELATSGNYDLIILDLKLPGLPGLEVLDRLRARWIMTPVLILSAMNETEDVIRGLRTGADGYMTKPFELRELLARIDALLRRYSLARSVGPAITTSLVGPGTGPASTESTSETHRLRFDDIVVDIDAREVFRDGRPVALRHREMDLLLALVRHPGHVISRVELLHEVWGQRNAIRTRTVDVHITWLRHKLEKDPAHPRHIVTVSRAGYRFDP